jgi:hypothetical protein
MRLRTNSLVWFCWFADAVWLVLASRVIFGFCSDWLEHTSEGVYGAFLLLPVVIAYVGMRAFIDLKREEASRTQLRIVFILSIVPVLGYLIIPVIYCLLWAVGQMYLHGLRGQ